MCRDSEVSYEIYLNDKRFAFHLLFLILWVTLHSMLLVIIIIPNATGVAIRILTWGGEIPKGHKKNADKRAFLSLPIEAIKSAGGLGL